MLIDGYDCVCLHLIDEGIDTGLLKFYPDYNGVKTFLDVSNKIKEQIESLLSVIDFIKMSDVSFID